MLRIDIHSYPLPIHSENRLFINKYCKILLLLIKKITTMRLLGCKMPLFNRKLLYLYTLQSRKDNLIDLL